MAYVQVLEALVDSTRRQIVEILAVGPQSVGSIADRLPVSRPAVSQHLRKLFDSGLVTRTHVSQRNVYALRRDGLSEVKAYIEGLWSTALDRFQDAARLAKEEELIKIDPVVKTIEVPLTPRKAFELFTSGIGRWWPFESHSVYGSEAVSLEFQARVGGQLIESGPGGQQSVWGTVDGFDPPNMVSFTWHPGREPTNPTHVTVSFAPVTGGTRVVLLHEGWERLGDRAAEARANYNNGWEAVFIRRFGDAAAEAAGA